MASQAAPQSPMETSDVEVVISMDDLFDKPTYNDIPVLGSGTLKSVYVRASRFTMLKPTMEEATGPSKWTEAMSIQTVASESVWVTAMTMAEYNAMVDADGQLTTFCGSFRAEQRVATIDIPSYNSGCSDLAFHLSRGHATYNEDEGPGLRSPVSQWTFSMLPATCHQGPSISSSGATTYNTCSC